MKRWLQRGTAVVLLVLLLLPLLPVGHAADKPERSTILFTHDLHDFIFPFSGMDGEEYLGFPHLAGAIAQERRKDRNLLLLDGGDFSMGTLLQTLYTDHAPELQLLGQLGVDVTTLGNHEWDYRAEGLAKMLSAALAHTALPQIVLGNYKPDAKTAPIVTKALDAYGVKEYTILERGGLRYAIFGIFGVDADKTAPMSGFELEEPIAAAKRIVAEIQANEDYDMLICLSHSGVRSDPKKSEDELLAKAVPEINLILSAHTHTLLREPIVVGSTYIVSAHEYGKYLGKAVLERESAEAPWVMAEYQLIPITAANTALIEDAAMAAQVAQYKQMIDKEYLADFNLSYDQQLTRTDFLLMTPVDFEEVPLGGLIADSYIHTIERMEGKDYLPVDVAIVPEGVIRDILAPGPVTVADAYQVLSLGSGADGSPGYPLVSAYLTGKELMTMLEIDASIAPLMRNARLYISGMQYTYNPNRMFLDKVVANNMLTPDGQKLAIDENQLYRVVADLYSVQMLGAVKDVSHGLLSIMARDETGTPITDYDAHIIHMPDGSELKAWHAFALYLQSFGDGGIPQIYAAPQGRKIVEDSKNPIHLIKYPGAPTIIVLVLLVLVVGLLGFLLHRFTNRNGRRRRRMGSYRQRPYRGR